MKTSRLKEAAFGCIFQHVYAVYMCKTCENMFLKNSTHVDMLNKQKLSGQEDDFSRYFIEWRCTLQHYRWPAWCGCVYCKMHKIELLISTKWLCDTKAPLTLALKPVTIKPVRPNYIHYVWFTECGFQSHIRDVYSLVPRPSKPSSLHYAKMQAI